MVKEQMCLKKSKSENEEEKQNTKEKVIFK